MIAGVRKTNLQFIPPCVVWLLWPSATSCFLSRLFSLYSIPKKGHNELWLRREEQPVVAALSQLCLSCARADTDTQAAFPCGSVPSPWVQTIAQSHNHKRHFELSHPRNCVVAGCGQRLSQAVLVHGRCG